MTHRYFHSGVHIASQIELPEWAAFVSDDTCIPAIDIALEETLKPSAGLGAAAQYRNGALMIDILEAGRFTISDGTSIRLRPLAGAGEAERRLFLLGSAWASLGYQRGWAMVHGSAVEISGRATVFCGDAGAGKSTFAAAMAKRGHRLLADDLSRADSGGPGPVFYPSATRLKLWDEAIEQLRWREKVIQRDHFRDEKFHLAAPDRGVSADPVPLGPVCVLEWGEPSCERLRGGVAVRALADASMYRKPILELMGRMADHMIHCARIAARAPVYKITRPRDFAGLDSACAQIEALSFSD